MIGDAYRSLLTQEEQRALDQGMHLLIDRGLKDYGWIVRGEEPPEPLLLAWHLPSQDVQGYSPEFYQQFLVCLLTVAWKWGRPRRLKLASVAEELAGWAIVNEAKSMLKQTQKEFVWEEALLPFVEVAFEDLDFVFLFEEEYAGIEESPVGEHYGNDGAVLQGMVSPVWGHRCVPCASLLCPGLG